MATDLEEQKKLLLPILQVRYAKPDDVRASPLSMRVLMHHVTALSSCMPAQRAEEIQAVEPRMAYYCRLYAIKKVRQSYQYMRRAAHASVLAGGGPGVRRMMWMCCCPANPCAHRDWRFPIPRKKSRA